MASNSLNTTPAVQEFNIRVPKNSKKKFHIMRFNHALKVEFPKWNQVKLERENNLREYHGHDEEIPKFGAGSEFGKEQREEARRKKYGIILKRYKPEDQPWILKVGGKTGKKFKGIREGGVSDNASYYVFTHAADGGIEAYPLNEWYNFQPIQRYKCLSAEEAEQEFGRRNKVINYFNLMTRKRLRNEDGGEVEEGEELKGKKGKKGKGKSELKISEMDEWVDSEEGMSDSDEGEKKEEEEDEENDKKKKGKKGDDKKKKKKKKDSDEEAFEESDDGDEEGREVDYISDSSLSGSDLEIDEKGVAEEDALKKLLNSDEDDEEEEKKNEESEPEEEKEGGEGGPDKKKEESKKKKKKKEKKKPKKEPSMDMLNESSTSYSTDSSDSDAENSKKKSGKNKESNSDANSRSASPTAALLGEAIDGKRKTPDSGSDINLLDGGPSSKKPRLDNAYILGSNDSGITEEAVRRYLIRKPMTTTELLQKFKKGKTGLTSEQLVNIMTQILKRINPIRQTIKGKMYLSLKP